MGRGILPRAVLAQHGLVVRLHEIIAARGTDPTQLHVSGFIMRVAEDTHGVTFTHENPRPFGAE